MLSQSVRWIIFMDQKRRFVRRNISLSKCHCSSSQGSPSAPWNWAKKDKEKKYWSFSRVPVFLSYVRDRCGPCPEVYVKVRDKRILAKARKTNLLRISERLHTNEMLHLGTPATFKSTDLNSTGRRRRGILYGILYFDSRRKLDRSL